MAVTEHREQNIGASGYSWLYLSGGRAKFLSLFVILVGAAIGGAVYVWYTQHSNDVSPDSTAGYSYAIIGTVFLLLAAILYSLQRRSHKKRAVGQLHKSLNWHIC